MAIDFTVDFGDRGLRIGRKTNILIPFTNEINPRFSSIRFAFCYATQREGGAPIEETRDNTGGDNSIYIGFKTAEISLPHSGQGQFFGITNKNNNEVRISDDISTWNLYTDSTDRIGIGKVDSGVKNVELVNDGIEIPKPSDISSGSTFNKVFIVDFLIEGLQYTTQYQQTDTMNDKSSRTLKNRINDFVPDGAIAAIPFSGSFPSNVFVAWPFVRNKLILYSLIVQGKR